MKRILFSFITLLIFGSISSYGQEIKNIDSRVISSTVFSNRALVTREAEVQLSPGKYQLVLSNLTPDFLDESVRVSGKGTAQVKILDVKVETKYTAEIQEKKVKKLQQKLDSLRFESQVVTDRIAVLETQKSFIEALKVESARDINREMIIKKPSIQDWQNMLQFFDKNLTQVYYDLRKQKQVQEELTTAINAVEKEISQTRTHEKRSYKQIMVTVEVLNSGYVTLHSSYVINNASWYPLYDARVTSETRKMELTYYGMVRQSTGEDWSGVELTLSAAQPLVTRTLPELQPWFVDVYQPPPSREGLARQMHAPKAASEKQALFAAPSSPPFRISYRGDSSIPAGRGRITGRITDIETGEPLPGANVILEGTTYGAATDLTGNFTIVNIPVGSYLARVSMIGYQTTSSRINVREKQVLNLEGSLPPAAIEGEAVTVFAERSPVEQDLVYATAEVRASQTSAVFNIPVKSDIPSDNTPRKVTIAIQPLDIEFEYTTIPRLIPKAFLKGKVVNQTEYPLLAGEVNVFFENDFVNKTRMETIVPTEKFELSLGTDDGIKVERKLIKKYTESKGIFGGKEKVIYEYEIIITNNKKTEENIWVTDQLPMSRNEKVKVQLLAPDEKEVEIDNQKRIKWQLRLKPTEKRVLSLKYQIEFPSGVRVSGLD